MSSFVPVVKALALSFFIFGEAWLLTLPIGKSLPAFNYSKIASKGLA